jgi:sugar O-acyltransferase (sialic acid O-acetyltransferase NeuD family)
MENKKRNHYRIIGKGGLHDIIKEILQDTLHYDGYYDNKQVSQPSYRGSFSEISFPEAKNFILGFASIRNMLRREKLFQQLLASGAFAVNAISDKAYLFSTVSLGTGNVICPLSNVGANVTIGSNCIIFSNTTIEHDTKVGNNVNIAPGVSFGGGCHIGNNVFVGIGSVIRDQISIGNNVVIGAGSLVLDNVKDNCIAYGSPAKVIGVNKLYEQPA